MPGARGTPAVSPPLTSDLAALLSSLGDVNMSDRGFGFSLSESGLWGRDDVWCRRVTLKAGDTEIEVPHALGRVPGWAHMLELESGPSNDSACVATSVKKPSWTLSTVRVRITAVGAGSIAGARATFLIGG
jgi:hypothetical protein